MDMKFPKISPHSLFAQRENIFMADNSQPHSQVPDPRSAPAPDLHEAVRRRAEEIYARNGKLPGRDMENWAQAEAEILQQFSANTRRTAVVFNVQGVQYVGEYNAAFSDGYTPGEFSPGTPVPVRIEGDKMFVSRRNGTELETNIVQRVG
jgi:hypothetical protein